MIVNEIGATKVKVIFKTKTAGNILILAGDLIIEMNSGLYSMVAIIIGVTGTRGLHMDQVHLEVLLGI